MSLSNVKFIQFIPVWCLHVYFVIGDRENSIAVVSARGYNNAVHIFRKLYDAYLSSS